MTAPARYCKKPVEVDAIQWDGTTTGAALIADWVSNKGGSASYVCFDHPAAHSWISITTLEGPMRIPPGWWVIRGIVGEFYGCAPHVFDLTYEAAP